MKRIVHAINVNLDPRDVARYFLIRAFEDGDLFSNLKLQKLVYYGYAWALVKDNSRLFSEKIEAWVNGPVVPSLYSELKQFGLGPVKPEWLDGYTSEEIAAKINADIRATLDEVYEKYGALSAFELVALTHSEKPWLHAREGLKPSDQSGKAIDDSDILEEYGSREAF